MLKAAHVRRLRNPQLETQRPAAAGATSDVRPMCTCVCRCSAHTCCRGAGGNSRGGRGPALVKDRPPADQFHTGLQPLALSFPAPPLQSSLHGYDTITDAAGQKRGRTISLQGSWEMPPPVAQSGRRQRPRRARQEVMSHSTLSGLLTGKAPLKGRNPERDQDRRVDQRSEVSRSCRGRHW